ncbi:facilitated trehalose transporter Tret1-2 homolog [Zophobas morio]|uniref:facilitated trehalose transporter Tret1-2 homolog n=1 Tax=Zophobas morio TaxID=2755281 RepID=UPI003083CEFB
MAFFVTFLTSFSLFHFCFNILSFWTSPTVPKVLSDEYPFDVTQEEASYITIIGPLGDIVGKILSSILVDLIGRKFTILLIGVPQLVSMAMIYFSTYSVLLLYVARFIGGISEGSCFTILPLYICEVSEPKIRGLLGASFSLILIYGLLFVNLVGSFFGIFDAALIYIACSLVFMACFSIMPESPYYLIMKNKLEQAKASLRRLRACEDVDLELASLSKDVARQMSEKGRFKDLYAIKSNKMAVIVMIILRVLQQFSGISPFTMYAQLMFKDATDAIPQQWAASLMMLIQSFATLTAVLIVDVIGRKPMILISVGGCCVTLTFNAVFFVLRDYTDVEVSHLGVLPLVGLILFTIFFSLGLGSAVNLLLGELFPANVKALAACLLNMIFAVGMLTTTKFYQFMADTFSLVIPFAVFGLFQFVGFVFCWKYVPETKNKTLEQIQQELKGNKDAKGAL